MLIQQGEGQSPVILLIRYPDELPHVNPCFMDLAYAEVMKAAGTAQKKLEANFWDFYTDPVHSEYRVVHKLKHDRGEVEVIVIASYAVHKDIVEDWIRTLVIKPLLKWLVPQSGSDEVQHLRALKLQEIAEARGIEPDCVDESRLRVIEEELGEVWDLGNEINFIFPPFVSLDPDEPDETTYANLAEIVPEIGSIRAIAHLG